MENKFLNFQDVWEASEKLTKEKLKHLSNEQLQAELLEEISNFYAFDGSIELSDATKALMRTKRLGTILFLLSALTLRENINSWEALYNQIEFEKIDLKNLSKSLAGLSNQSADSNNMEYNPLTLLENLFKTQK